MFALTLRLGVDRKSKSPATSGLRRGGRREARFAREVCRFVQAASAGAPRDREVTMRDDAIAFARASHLSARSAAQRACERATRDFSVLLMFRIC